MRSVDRIIWHCSASPEGRADTTEAIRAWHKSKGWRDIGYHFVIELDGVAHVGRPLDQPGAHTKGHNDHSIGICYIGGMAADMSAPKDTRTEDQKRTLYALTADLLEQFPGATVHGHNEFDSKACPSFDVARDWEQYQQASGFDCPGCCCCKGKT